MMNHERCRTFVRKCSHDAADTPVHHMDVCQDSPDRNALPCDMELDTVDCLICGDRVLFGVCVGCLFESHGFGD